MTTLEGVDLMEELGGSFVRAIAKAWRCADHQNKAKLEQNFSYFQEYSDRAAKQMKCDGGSPGSL